MTDCIQVMVTVEERGHAERIAETLLAEQLAACVQVVGPITSYFHWQGQNEKSEEYLCLIKSRRYLYEEIETAVKQAHPYEVPEILALPVVAGNAAYLAWVAQEVKGEAE